MKYFESHRHDNDLFSHNIGVLFNVIFANKSRNNLHLVVALDNIDLYIGDRWLTEALRFGPQNIQLG